MISRVKNPMNRTKRIGYRLLAAALGIGVALILMEVGLRAIYYRDFKRGGDLHRRLDRSQRTALGHTRGDFDMAGLVQPSVYADVVYELKPGIEGGFRGMPVKTNSQGWRGAERSAEKPAGVFRVAGIGDSVMFGWGVGEGEYYLSLLEDLLNSRAPAGKRFECLNLAVPGYNTTMEVAALEHRGMAFDPDLVVLQFITNDFGLPLFMERARTGLERDRSYLLTLVMQRVSWVRGHADTYLVGARGDGKASVEEMKRTVGPYYYMTGHEGFARAAERLAQLTGNAPPPEGEAPRRKIPVILLRGTYLESQRVLLDETAARYGFEMLDIGPITERWLNERGYTQEPAERKLLLRVGKGDSHPNQLGHRIYADGLLEKMAAMELIPGQTPP